MINYLHAPLRRLPPSLDTNMQPARIKRIISFTRPPKKQCALTPLMWKASNLLCSSRHVLPRAWTRREPSRKLIDAHDPQLGAVAIIWFLSQENSAGIFSGSSSMSR